MKRNPYRLLANPSESPKTLPSLSKSHSPNIHKLSPSTQVGVNFSTQIEKFPQIYKSRSDRHMVVGPTRIPDLQPSKVLLVNHGKIKIVAANTCSGCLNRRNDDRVRIVLDVKRPVLFAEEKWPKSSFFAVFDGHGGGRCAEFMKDSLYEYIFTDKNFPYEVKKAAFHGFQAVEQRFLELAEEQNDFSGSCAITALIIGDKCLISNIGDSQAILSLNTGQKIITLSTSHTPSDTEEQQRVRNSGGKLFCEYFINEIGLKVETGVVKVNPGGLSVTRCLGSPQVKLENLGASVGVILAEPSFKSFTVKENFDFLVLASGGLFSKVSEEEMVEMIWTGIKGCESGVVEEKVDEGMKYLFRKVLERENGENFSVVLIGFQNLVKYCNSCM